MRVHSRKSSASRPALPTAVLKAIERSAKAEFNKLTALPFHPANQKSLSGAEVVRPAKGRSTKSARRNSLLSILSDAQVIYFNPENKYLVHPEQLWLIKSIMGTQAYREALSIEEEPVINDQFIEKLFEGAPFAFYLSADGAYLLSTDDELTQLDFGLLTKVSALEALQRFGLVTLEQAKEKTVVRL